MYELFSRNLPPHKYNLSLYFVPLISYKKLPEKLAVFLKLLHINSLIGTFMPDTYVLLQVESHTLVGKPEGKKSLERPRRR
jgi:hypothetical protein